MGLKERWQWGSNFQDNIGLQETQLLVELLSKDNKFFELSVQLLSVFSGYPSQIVLQFSPVR